MNDFEVGDLVICTDDLGTLHVEKGRLYKVSGTYTNTLMLNGVDFTWSKTRFRKVKIVPDTKITRLLCKVYKEENGYIYI